LTAGGWATVDRADEKVGGYGGALTSLVLRVFPTVPSLFHMREADFLSVVGA